MTINSMNPTNFSVTGTESMNTIDFSLLKKSMDQAEISGDMITKMLEQSVNPNIGSNIDLRV